MESSQTLEIEYILIYKGDTPSQVWTEVYNLNLLPLGQKISFCVCNILFKMEILGSHTLRIQM